MAAGSGDRDELCQVALPTTIEATMAKTTVGVKLDDDTRARLKKLGGA